MEGLDTSAKDGSHHNNLDNIYVELNNQPSELLQTVKDIINCLAKGWVNSIGL